MRIRRKRVILIALLLGLVGVSAGCDMATFSYFMSKEQRLDAKLKHLASEDDKVEPKVVIFTYCQPGDVPFDFIGADRALAEMLGRNLQQFAQDSQEKLALLPQRRVEEFKNANPNWKSMGWSSVGRRLGADYVIYLEINSMSLYEKQSNNALFRGRASILASVTDVSKPDDPPTQQEYSCVFPNAQGPIPAGLDTNPQQFRQEFLTHVARQLTYYFAKYPRSEQRLVEKMF